ncbi:MAG: hypothetical protein JWL64_2704 [Frankiales bacterium]|nr:hypothetical protein [Frankiales bacterium]
MTKKVSTSPGLEHKGGYSGSKPGSSMGPPVSKPPAATPRPAAPGSGKK